MLAWDTYLSTTVAKKHKNKEDKYIHVILYYGFHRHQIAKVIRRKKKTKKKRRVRFLNNIEIIKEWQLLIIMGERKEEEIVIPKNIKEYMEKQNIYKKISIVMKLDF